MDGSAGQASTRTTACNVSQTVVGRSVTVNNGSGVRNTPLRSSVQHSPLASLQRGHVLATPLSVVQCPVTTPRPTGHQSGGKLDKVIVKAVCRGAKKDSRSFTLRNLDTAEVCSCDDVKEAIKRQLHHDITAKDFDVGYVHGSSVVRIRSREDLAEVWADLSKLNSKTTLWCDGLKEPGSRKKKHSEADSDDDEGVSGAKRKKQPSRRDEEVQDAVESLKNKHGSHYTLMQYRIWGEMIVGGLHENTDDPPNTTMFARAGGGTPYRKKTQPSPVTELLTEAATAITSALSPKPTASTGGMGTSPAKLIESRSKLYKQLSELQNLRSMGVLTDDEFFPEKESIMELLKKFKTTASGM